MKLFPSRKPYRKGFFKVSDCHELFYALYGNPRGVPVLFVHGGPGAGCSESAHRHFNPKKFNILTIDQRGAGKSRPFAGLRGNTTQKLVKDLRDFLRFLKIEKTFLFGGSWGSCLSLCYAIKYSKTVLGMVLRGIYLGSGFDDDFMLTGGPKHQFPDVWKRFVGVVPKRFSERPSSYYWRMMHSKNKRVMKKYCREWALYESSLLRLEYDPKQASKDLWDKRVIALAKIEAHFFRNGCFLSNNYILRNAGKLKNIPLSIVHGRYDFVCPAENAYRLHVALPKSKLFIVTAGHSVSDGAIRESVMRELHRQAKRF
ncbi:prolyl aminopeptidase [Candidatus Woesearchaeota archaeon]|nr:prolyl aminopeptidase [Candidatus Woesearchaeota archaeon]